MCIRDRHYVFDSPKDKIVFDVSHQSYVHKMLTGRKQAFTDPAHYHDVTGYTNPDESEHDFFTVGHTSTSVSLACGLAKARDLKGEKDNIIAVIGDGSLSGGEAYEGLNNAVEAGTNMIVVVNDNEMSIAENHGGMYNNLRELRETDGKAANNFFKAIGFDYVYVGDGNDTAALVAAFRSVKDSPRPVVVHIHTPSSRPARPSSRGSPPTNASSWASGSLMSALPRNTPSRWRPAWRKTARSPCISCSVRSSSALTTSCRRICA